jgi:hypothetical protein
MAGDFTRNTHDRSKQYVAVNMQQGRVQLDADWNEQGAIARERLESETIDVVGRSGAPKKNSGFLLVPTPDGLDLVILPGRFYVDGIAVELSTGFWTVTARPGVNFITAPTTLLDGRPLRQGDWVALTVGNATQQLIVDAFDANTMRVTFTANVSRNGRAQLKRIPTFRTQPFRESPALPEADGRYLFYLDVWDREITALGDESIREVALGGPDTATRTQIVWQVRWTQVGDVDCSGAQFPDATRPSSGMLTAFTTPPDDDTDPCHLPPTAGFRGLENQLFRVEVHRGGMLAAGAPDPNGPTFKWSQHNASIETRASNPNASAVTVHDLGRDDVLGFAERQWVELIDDKTLFEAYAAGSPNPLSQIDDIDEASLELTMTHPVPVDGTARGLKLRRWDMPDTTDQPHGVPMTTADFALGSGVSIRFDAGTYHSGDYWLIPARTTRQIEWPGAEDGHPAPLPPQGVHHHYAKLAIVDREGGELARRDDCRKPFAALTDLCAVDICFDNEICEFPTSVRNVQQAIDELCRRTDIRRHNKYLHGYGVVCGLQLACDGDLQVRVNSGYAIDCEGYDIFLAEPDPVPLRDIEGNEHLGPSRSVCLTIARNADGSPRYAIRPHGEHDQSWRERFRDTLLVDYYNNTIDPLLQWYRDNLDPQQEGGPVSPQQRNLSTLFNLFIQIANPRNGSKVFISPEEDRLLRELYASLLRFLRDELGGSSRCIPPNLGQLPDYPFTEAMLDERTIFGKGFRTRIRIHRELRLAYAFGNDDTIDVYELMAGNLVFRLQFRGVVRDVAVSAADPAILYAVADVDGQTFFAQAPSDGPAVFTRERELKGYDVPTIITTPGENQRLVYGADLNGSLIEIDPATGRVREIAEIDGIKPTGQLLADGGFLFALAATKSATAGKYNALVFLQLRNPDPRVIPLDEQGDDDFSVSLQNVESGLAWVVVDPRDSSSTKRVLGINLFSGSRRFDLDLESETRIRMARLDENGGAALSYEDDYEVRLLSPANGLRPGVPVQVCPISIAFVPEMRNLVVLNTASNTMNAVGSRAFSDPIPIDVLKNYRADMIQGWLRLFGLVVETLKDRFCEELLIDCPTCTERDEVFLGCLELDENIRVQRICALEHRKYVHTFRSVEYWLSLIPIQRLLTLAIQRFCCSDIADRFGRIRLPRETHPDRFHCDETPNISTLIDTLRDLFLSSGRSIASRGKFFADWLLRLDKEKPRMDPRPDPRDFIGQPVDAALLRLREAGIDVNRVTEYQPAFGRQAAITAVTRFAAGVPVTLVQRKGRVAYFTDRVSNDDLRDLRTSVKDFSRDAKSIRDAAAGVASFREDIDGVRSDLDSTRKEFETTRQHVDDARKDLDNVQDAVSTARDDVERVRKESESTRLLVLERDAAIREVLNLRELVDALQNANKEAQKKISELTTLAEGAARSAREVDALKTRIDVVERLIRRPPG